MKKKETAAQRINRMKAEFFQRQFAHRSEREKTTHIISGNVAKDADAAKAQGDALKEGNVAAQKRAGVQDNIREDTKQRHLTEDQQGQQELAFFDTLVDDEDLDSSVDDGEDLAEGMANVSVAANTGKENDPVPSRVTKQVWLVGEQAIYVGTHPNLMKVFNKSVEIIEVRRTTSDGGDMIYQYRVSAKDPSYPIKFPCLAEDLMKMEYE